MKKFLSVTLTLALLLLVFAGCQSSNPQPQQPGDAVSGQGQSAQDNTTVGETVPDATQAKEITADEAKAIALEHALLKASDVTGLTAQYDVDDGVAQYEVDFRQGDYDYDYEIHAVTGKVLSFDKEYEPVKAQEQQPADTQQPAAGEKLTEAEAKAVALKHAGAKEKDVSGLRIKYEVDDGVPQYDVDFRYGDYEYDYEIHAKTGKVISYDKDYDPVEVQTGGSAAKVTADEAKAIALKHAGLKEGDVTGLRVEYEVDDGIPQYDVEFRRGGYEYSYEIHGETGKILQSEKELDD